MKRAAKSYQDHPLLKRSFAFEMGNIMRKNFETKKANPREAYLWYLYGINSPEPPHQVSQESFIRALGNMYKTGELRKASPELNAVWMDEKKRNEILHPNKLSDLPSWLDASSEEKSEHEVAFSFLLDDFNYYEMDVYKNGKVKLKLNNFLFDQDKDLYLQVSPSKVEEFLGKLRQLGFDNWPLNNSVQNIGSYLCSSSHEICPTNNYVISVYPKLQQRQVYLGVPRLAPEKEKQNLKKIAGVFALVEEYFPTSMLRCQLGNSVDYIEDCTFRDKKLINLANQRHR